jgi:hypothetical protein
MRTKDFVHDFIVRKSGTSAISRVKFDPYSDRNRMKIIQWEYYHKLADLTSLLTFGCNFSELGCERRKWPSIEAKERAAERDPRQFKNSQMCCCSACRISFGHWYILPNSESTLKMYARNFNKETGFWREGKGCILKRKYRSPICLTARCGIPVKPRKSGDFLLFILHDDQETILHKYRTWTKSKSICNMDDVIRDLRRRIKKEIRDENSTNSK